MYYYKIQLYFQPAILCLQHNYVTTLRNNGKETYIEQMKVNSYKAQKIMNSQVTTHKCRWGLGLHGL